MDEHGVPRLAYALRDEGDVRVLRSWVDEHLPRASLDELPRAVPFAAYADVCGHAGPYQLVILDEPSLGADLQVPASFRGPACPEILTVGLSPLVALRMRARGVPIAAELPGPLCSEQLDRAVAHVLQVRLPLNALSRCLVGRVGLRDAIALIRFYMLREAFSRVSSKRGAAKALGVTRPAVQSMARSLSMPESHPLERAVERVFT